MPEHAILASTTNNNNSGHDDTTKDIKIEADHTNDDDDEKQQVSWENTKDTVHLTNGVNGDHPDAPHPKRRKLVEEDRKQKLSPRAISPPWRSALAEGPTSFVEDGKRRSGRTNLLPIALQPPSTKRKTRAEQKEIVSKHVRTSSSLSNKAGQDTIRVKPSTPDVMSKRGPGRPRKEVTTTPAIKKETGQTKPQPKNQQVKDLLKSPSRKSLRAIPTKSKRESVHIRQAKDLDHSDDGSTDRISLHRPSPPLLLKKVSFRVRVPKPTVMTPMNIPMPKQYPSFESFIENDRLEEPGTRPLLTLDQIRREASLRLRVQRGARSSNFLNTGLANRLQEPKREYAHRDHLLAHVKNFRSLMLDEKRNHRRLAHAVALEAKQYVEAKQNKGRVKSVEEVERDKQNFCRACFKNVVKDLTKLWQAVETEVNTARQRRYEEEQKAKLQGHLNRVLDRTNEMLKKQDTDMSEDLLGSDADNSEEQFSSDSEDSEQISASESDSEAGAEIIDDDDDAGLTAEQLKAKYENIPEIAKDDEPEEELISAHEDSDPETVMDSEEDSEESYGSEEENGDGSADEDDPADEASEAEEEVEGGGGLLSLFFSKKELSEIHPDDPGQPTPPDSTVPDAAEDITPSAERISPETEADDEGQIEKVENITSFSKDVQMHDIDDHISEPTLNGDNAISKHHHAEPVERKDDSHDQAALSAVPAEVHPVSPGLATPSENKGPRTPIPPLLRGTLREYQHEGLDWLANLYANGRSGILADEMGLGKTIQSISLLAHLATTYEVWGPHLIVVPTSVMLNWEMEFKKFLPGFKILTYYGSLEERKAKRRGWMADDSFNVCITSYQLVLQDANSFKRRRWHYMILDEAHNIKNFRSERWQTMMTFNTRARLLLTGTPLQNNLTELWSLLFFLHYGQEQEGEDDAFAGLREWSEWFKRPVESILEHGKQVLDQEDQAQVAKLHKVIRPFLLRRLKRDVEKQMPLKYEHVELCRLSKRQRQLYDGFMSRAQTRETLSSGNYLSIINALMQLRKVCNHPDLFETRPINTSFAMPRSVAATYEINDFLVRRKLHQQVELVDLNFLQLAPISNENMSMTQLVQTQKRHAYQPFKDLRDKQWQRVRNRSKIFASADRNEVLCSLENTTRRARLSFIDRTMYYEAYKHHQHPIYGSALLKKLSFNLRSRELSQCSLNTDSRKSWEQTSALSALDLVQSLATRSERMSSYINKYACITPAVVATDLATTTITEVGTQLIRQRATRDSAPDPFHLARMKLSIAFPDKRLLQYDCGKLQRLDRLLRRLQSGGHRALIFTQMTKVLDILEQFLNIHGHRYLRLDGATKIEQRQILTDRFNNDPRILCFILSSRSGGLGINLTGADTVIFYDLDWNPAMDKQCTDRAHRIGQTRDVHIYRFVSEHTIESNILRKANQKQLLDDVVIQEGDFTTDYLNKMDYRDMLDDTDNGAEDVAGAAMDRVLGNDRPGEKVAFEQVEDKEDIDAARVAAKEAQNVDEGDFDDTAVNTTADNQKAIPSKTQALDPYAATNAAIQEVEDEKEAHIDDYLLRMMQWLLKDVPLLLPRDKDRRKKGRERDRRRR